MQDLIRIIEDAFDHRLSITPENISAEIKNALEKTISLLDQGEIRVAEKKSGQWVVNTWIKKAILLLFRAHENKIMESGDLKFFDKIALKFQQYSEEDFQQAAVRVVPSACVRQGAFLAKNTILMPSYVNIGAYVDSGTLVDTWATVGSCAQIGKNVHLSGGVGIGGVLEPLQAAPVIIEDNCFIGARSEIVEGVIVEEGAVISMGVYLGQSTPIYNRDTAEISYGRVPAGAVVIPGTLPSKDGRYGRYSAIIVKFVDEKTRSKVSLNELLRTE